MKYNLKLMGWLVLLTVSLTACQSDSTDANSVENQIVVTSTAAETTVFTDGFKTIGAVRPANVLSVTPALGGTIKEVFVKNGAYVEAGDILYRLDDSTAKANYEATVSSLKTTRDNLSIQLKDAEKQLADIEALHAVGAATDSARTSAQSQVSSLSKQYDNAATAYREQVRILSAGITDYTVKSPVEGIVNDFELNAGERVSSQTAVQVIQTDGMLIETALTFDQLKRLDTIEKSVVTIDGDVYDADVETLSFLQNEITKMYDVTLTLLNVDEMLLDGIACEIDFLEAPRTAMTLPLSAIKYIGEDQYAFYIEDSTAVRVPVELGSIAGDRIEVRDLPTDKVWIARGVDQIQDGMRVQILE
ncbi:efflux RND transporter periplasmic adaptor subunit [Fusibacter paucivorans]|uniref:Efflux RND transporter periplasmic adaptor subunit n=1 Tax=Fusibacter paucivorans TaxID=76009 RepID=A0ABS5PM89_9FIRM|nr:efflux RND transporter periplasmic adaptor subunit [Fusibacter paucivorans]MBS7526280.1 efflux RND transporter periplasmic adaptor subunit [Fusibacter paucivorans]